jgi:flavin reductase (DIM6/NTAB) family NADH-FMN oxidoreductase RutF
VAGSGGNGKVSSGPEAFRGLAGHLVTGVSVVITLVEGEPMATTAGSVVAASWDPPLLAVFFRAGSRMATAIDGSRRFTVNILGESDAGLARRFARPHRERGWAALAGIPLERRDPAPPIFAHAAAWAECATVHAIPLGDHVCFAGEVLASHRDESVAPLAYYRGRFRALGPGIAPAPWMAVDAAELTAVW